MALDYRKEIPLFYDKSEKEFRQDSYESYDLSVIRQTMIHLSDHLWDEYPMQKTLDYGLKHIPKNSKNIVEIGCGVGRLIGEIAAKYSDANCWGIDYSYQMLKKAKETWIDGKSTDIDLSKYGFDENTLESHKLSNLQFGLAKCEDLPFSDQSQDLIISSFLLDRLSGPIQGLKEMKRILRPGGKIVIITPLNFVDASHWERFYPPTKLKKALQEMHFEIVDWTEDITIDEPLDKRGNVIQWKCLGLVCK